MTHPMLEKVARAIAAPIVRQKLANDWTLCHAPDVEALTQRIIDREWNRHVDVARAAVRALMEPDEAMVEASFHDDVWEEFDDTLTADVSRRVFRAMLLPLIEGEGE